MAELLTYLPPAIYARDGHDATARVLIAPPKYLQGPGVLTQTGRYLRLYGWSRVGILASARGHAHQAGIVRRALEEKNIHCKSATFGGECSLPEIDARVSDLHSTEVEALVAVGGGKCVDAGKSIAERLGVPIVVVPTLASNDAPCSAVSMVYTPEGVVHGAEFFAHSPVIVIVDTAEIASAPERYLVAGMGDAMATWYEAKVCMENPSARTLLGTRPTLTGNALGELCARTLYDQGEAAAEAVRTGTLCAALEDVVEANTLLSGVGFESGGLAGAHGYAQGFTALPRVEHNHLHGEMVALGVIGQLMLQQQATEAERAATFFARVGLPITLSQLSMTSDSAQLDTVIEGALTFTPFENLPFEVTPVKLRNALIAADALGNSVAASIGDSAWRALQG